ncbi:hypothetical protein C5748_00070 [Phyllobacterium phragmitis]|uniref:Uncharacterized protein n=1 Tax=Phyllobacterium phragmitis TaxID=2670329 RepID=A0A2S9IYK3_9HYPH|nr:hypothetical protein [Phyllobacterium phragmitis]PRD45612.1 hypothetical protein C5748_00070 [Phyllobacterium phragmitis]
MDRMARLFAILLLALFATGAIAHATQTARMSAAMSAADMTNADMSAGMGADMGDCEGCPEDDGKAAMCDQGCLTPFVGISVAAGIQLPALAADTADCALAEMNGHAVPPALSPPRTTIQS